MPSLIPGTRRCALVEQGAAGLPPSGVAPWTPRCWYSPDSPTESLTGIYGVSGPLGGLPAGAVRCLGGCCCLAYRGRYRCLTSWYCSLTGRPRCRRSFAVLVSLIASLSGSLLLPRCRGRCCSLAFLALAESLFCPALLVAVAHSLLRALSLAYFLVGFTLSLSRLLSLPLTPALSRFSRGLSFVVLSLFLCVVSPSPGPLSSECSQGRF